MRTFLLIDNDGNSYDITSKDYGFFYRVTGLGYEKDTKFQRIKERYALLSKNYVQQEIEGTVRFWQDNAETKYFEFAQFCQNSPLKMVYNSQAGTTSSTSYDSAYVDDTTLYLPSTWLVENNYYRDGYITKIERSDGVDDCLTVKITFKATTPWYKSLTEYNYGGDTTEGKSYSYTYDYSYGTNTSNSVSIDSDSRMLSPCKVVIIGPATNPEWNHYVNGELVTSGKVTATIPSDYRLIIDTTTIPYSITEVDSYGELVADLYQSSDFSTDRFVRLQYGTNLITVAAEDVESLAMGVEAQIEYATV